MNMLKSWYVQAPTAAPRVGLDPLHGGRYGIAPYVDWQTGELRYLWTNDQPPPIEHRNWKERLTRAERQEWAMKERMAIADYKTGWVR